MRKTALMCLALVALAGQGAHATAPLPVPVESAVYEHLEHFRALGHLSTGLETRPVRASDLADAVREIEAHAERQPLAAGDARRLDILRRALVSFERTRPSTRADSAGAPSSLWRYGGGLQLFGQGSALDSLADLDRRPRRDPFFDMFLDVELPQGFYTQWRFYQDYSALTPSPGGNDWVDNLPPNLRDTLTDGSARNDVAVLGYGNRWLHAEFGRRDRHWGPGRRGTLFLSENAFPLDGLSLQLRTRWVVLTSLFAQSQRGDETGARGSAYVAAHRVEVRPPLPFRVGLYEAVAYGNRGIDLAYTNPVGFFLAMTQDIFDRSGTDDKKLVGLDVVVDLHPVQLYAELLIDRVFVLDAASEAEDTPISSFAQLAGLRWSNPLGWAGSDLDVEYAHLDPQVYFHKDGDPTRAFLSEGELLGHWLGPNADGLYVAWSSPPLRHAGNVRVFFEQTRHGIVDGKRGVDLGFFGLLQKDKDWITGARAVERIYALGWQRTGWPTGLGTLDTALTAARVVRSGAALDDDGWLLEMRLRWRVDWSSAF